jgi:tripartite-type tricarboxylate transporter receptor subunit TctC
VKSGRLRALAVTGPRRSPALPDIPAIAETVPGFSAELWYAMFAPANTPSDIINRLNRELREVLNQPEIRDKLSAQGVETQTSTPEDMTRLIASDLRKWEKVVKATGTRID